MKLKGRSLKRALETKDATRLTQDIPLITDTTEIITSEKAEEMLRRNRSNRPVNWNKVEQYCKLIENGQWKFHAQGIILDDKGNLLTGQKRLWAIAYTGISLPMRISRGTPTNVAAFIDRGVAQSSRDLASRETERKHSPIEASIARAMCALSGNTKPSPDNIAKVIVDNTTILELTMKETKGTKKNKAMYMILGVICSSIKDGEKLTELFAQIIELSEKLEKDLLPTEIDKCWNRGAAFTLAMKKATVIINNAVKKK